MAKRKAKKDDGILLSPKHGLNPSLDTCFWCGKSKGVALLGRIKKSGDDDVEAPKELVMSLEPCDDCKKKFALGVHLIEVDDDGARFNNNEVFAIKDTDGRCHWPTGRYAVIKPEVMKNGKAGSKALCDKTVMDHILGKQEQADA